MSHSAFDIELDDLTLARARRGDIAACEALFRLFHQPAYALAFRVCQCPQLAQDVTQEAFINAFRRIRQFRGDAPFWGWLRRVVVNQAISALRKLPRLAALAPPVPATDAWPHIEAALRRRRRIRHGTAGLASAAAVCLAIGLYWQLPRLQPGGELTQPLAAQTPAADTLSVNAGGDGATASDNLAALVSLAQKLERNLRAMRAETGVVPAQSLVYQVELEDLVSQIDEAINLQPESRELWSQRVNLLLDLNQLQRQQLRREYGAIASL